MVGFGSGQRRSAARAVALGILLAGPAVGRAQGDRSGQAAAFEAKGKQAYAKKRWSEAAAAFRLAYQASNAPKHLYNAARALEQQGDLAGATDLIDRYVAEETDAAQKADGEVHLQILQTRLAESHARVTVRSKPTGAQVLAEGAAGAAGSGVTPWTTWLPGGAWRIRAILANHQPFERDLIVQPGTPVTVHADLRPASPAAPAPQAPAAAARPDTAKIRLAVGSPKGVEAALRLDGQAKGALPLDADLPAGRHLIEVVADGYETWSRWVELKAGEDRTVELALTAVPEEEDGGGGGADAGGAAGAAVLGAGIGLTGAGVMGEGGGGGGGAAGSGAGGGGGGASGAEGASAPPDGEQAGGAGERVSSLEEAPPETDAERRKKALGVGRAPTGTALTASLVVAGTKRTQVSFDLDGAPYDAESEGDMDRQEYGVGLRFDSLQSANFGAGADVRAWVGSVEDGADVSDYPIELSPFLRLRIPIGVAGTDVTEAYAQVQAGLLMDVLTDKGRARFEEAGRRIEDIGFGWLAGASAGAQINLTGGLALFAEGGWRRQVVSMGIKEWGGSTVSQGALDDDMRFTWVNAGLVFLQ